MVSRRKLRNKKSHSRKSGGKGKRGTRIYKRTHKYGRKCSGGFRWPWQQPQQQQPQQQQPLQHKFSQYSHSINDEKPIRPPYVDPATVQEEQIILGIPGQFEMLVDPNMLLKVAGNIAANNVEDYPGLKKSIKILVDSHFDTINARNWASESFMDLFLPVYIRKKIGNIDSSDSVLHSPINQSKALKELFPEATLVDKRFRFVGDGLTAW